MNATQQARSTNVNDVIFWIYRCNLFLFLSKVYKIKSSTKPDIDGDPLEYLEKLSKITKITQKKTGQTKTLMLIGPINNYSNIYCEYEVNINIPEKELNEISVLMKKIQSDKYWDAIEVDQIDKAQKILLGILKTIKSEVKRIQNCKVRD